MTRSWTYVGIFLVAMATLMLEILLTRIVSVQAWYHLAFFIISLGMLGMTAGALLVFLVPRAFADEAIGARLAQASLAFAISVPVSLVLVLRAPLLPVSSFETFLGLLGPGAALAVPFVFSGLALTLALTRAGLPPGIAYGVDLCGAALGCVLVIPLLDQIDAPSAAVATASLAALGGVVFAATARRRSVAIVAVIVSAACIAVAALNASAEPAPLRPRWVKGSREDAAKFSYVRWNTYSRVTVGRSERGNPFFWGRAGNTPPAISNRITEQSMVVIDGLAATPMQRGANDPTVTEHVLWDVTQFAHHIRPRGPAAVIGVGGGRDVVAAVRAGHESVLGIELNKTIVELHRHVMAEYSGLTKLPVKLVNDEARSYLARDDGHYTVISMPMIDTWAATGAGAFSLSENGVYTVDAWKIFLARLTPDGVFTVSRWGAETTKMTALAFETLYQLGARDPGRHMVIVQGEAVATLVVSRSPFSDADIARIDAEIQRLGLRVLLHPRALPPYQQLAAIAQTRSSDELQRWAETESLDYSPPTDERPFFFNLLRPSNWLTGGGNRGGQSFQGNLQATRTLVFATLVSAVLAIVALLLPLLLRRASLRDLRRADVAISLLYFALIGFGFMFVELGLLSRLSVFLGHPTLALAVVLAGIILFTGLGSLASGRIPIESNRRWALFPLAPAALLVILVPVMGWLMHAAEGATTPARIALSALLIAPPALGLGLAFPLGLRLVQRISASLGPWLWGINGACGVVASGLALACSMVWGISTTLLVGASCYALLTLAALRLHRSA